MGNKSNDKKLRKKSQPQQILSSGVPSYPSTGVRRKLIKIKLIKLELTVLAKSEVGKAVSIAINEHYYCYLNGEILGEIPVDYHRQLATSSIYYATIIEVDKVHPSITIEVEL